MSDHTFFMTLALEQARAAASAGEVPIGAVLVHDGEVIASAGNRREGDRDPTAHAELLVLREGARVLLDWRLSGCTLYVTLEPCAMCAGALVLARIERLVYAVPDPKAGAVRSLYNIADDRRLNHRVDIVEGVMSFESAQMLTSFFQARRKATDMDKLG